MDKILTNFKFKVLQCSTCNLYAFQGENQQRIHEQYPLILSSYILSYPTILYIKGAEKSETCLWHQSKWFVQGLTSWGSHPGRYNFVYSNYEMSKSTIMRSVQVIVVLYVISVHNSSTPTIIESLCNMHYEY